MPSDELLARYEAVRDATRALCEPLSPEDAAGQSMPDASPAKWHLAHTTWFFETFILEQAQSGYRRFHPEFRVLFNSYYNSIGEQHPRPQRGLITRPSLEDVQRYRDHVDEHVTKLFENQALTPELDDVLIVGLHHEQQHQELLLTDVKHLFSCNPLQPAYRATGASRVTNEPTPGAAPPLTWHGWEEGLRNIGHAGDGFAFDNEGPRHRTWLDAFELASRAVTCGEFQAFVEDGGYTRPELWLSDGWSSVQQQGWQAPLYWSRDEPGASWRQLTLAGPREVRPDEPVTHVSFYEADAYARWVGARLPREEEWEVAATGRPLRGNFADSGRLHPARAEGDAAGPAQLFGDVWEWTASPYAPYPGFRAPKGALGEYNGKFMANQLVLRGGSCATPADHVRATYRNFFYPDQRWQFSGLRLARDL